jgi:hypothetical protein
MTVFPSFNDLNINAFMTEWEFKEQYHDNTHIRPRLLDYASHLGKVPELFQRAWLSHKGACAAAALYAQPSKAP